MVSPILEGIVVTCHIKRAVFNRHLITYEVWGGGGDAVVVVVVVVLVIVAVDIVELDVDGELLNFSLDPIQTQTLLLFLLAPLSLEFLSFFGIIYVALVILPSAIR